MARKSRQGAKVFPKMGVGSRQKGHAFHDPQSNGKPFSKAVPKSNRGKPVHGDSIGTRVVPMSKLGVSNEAG